MEKFKSKKSNQISEQALCATEYVNSKPILFNKFEPQKVNKEVKILDSQNSAAVS